MAHLISDEVDNDHFYPREQRLFQHQETVKSALSLDNPYIIPSMSKFIGEVKIARCTNDDFH
jgi:hypothetical protein